MAFDTMDQALLLKGQTHSKLKLEQKKIWLMGGQVRTELISNITGGVLLAVH